LRLVPFAAPPEDRAGDVAELARAVEEAGEIAAGEAVTHRRRNLDDLEAEAQRVQVEPHLGSEAAIEAADPLPGGARQAALTGERRPHRGTTGPAHPPAGQGHHQSEAALVTRSGR